MSKVGIIMGSKSDYPVMKEAEDILKEFDIDYEIEIVSAHRTPDKMMDYSKNAHKRGINVIIAGAGGAAHYQVWLLLIRLFLLLEFQSNQETPLMVGTQYYQFFKCQVESLLQLLR